MSHNSGNARRILLDGVFNCRDLKSTAPVLQKTGQGR